MLVFIPFPITVSVPAAPFFALADAALVSVPAAPLIFALADAALVFGLAFPA